VFFDAVISEKGLIGTRLGIVLLEQRNASDLRFPSGRASLRQSVIVWVMIMKYLWIFALLSPAIAEANEEPLLPLMYQEQVLVVPSLGTEGKLEIGAALIEQRTGEYRHCVVPKFTENPKDFLGVNRFVVKSGVPICRYALKEKKYTAEYQNFFNNVGQQWYNQLVNLKIKKDTFKLCAQSICTEDRPLNMAYVGPFFIDSFESKRYKISLNSIDGSVVIFSVDETIMSEVPQSFSREIRLDLNKGGILDYRGAKFQISLTSDSEIAFKIISGFDS
jgi:hypothetical protein